MEVFRCHRLTPSGTPKVCGSPAPSVGTAAPGHRGIVAFSTEEGEAMAKRLEMSVGDFYRRFARKVNGRGR